MSSPPEGQSPNLLLAPRYVFPPWRVCLYGAVPGLIFALLYGAFPNFEYVRLPILPPFGTIYLLGPYTAMIAAWGIAAVVRRKKDRHAREAALGLAMALAALAITAIAALGYATA